MSTGNSVPPVELLVAANEDAAVFYRQQLIASAEAGPRRYLAERGFAQLLEDTRWTVGFAPDGWTNLRDHMSSLGYSDATLVSAGLLVQGRRGTPYDRFRGRITFGIRNDARQLVGFCARSAPNARGNAPKYLNTSDTQLFQKHAELFGLGEQLDRGTAGSSVVVVEGPLDAIAVDFCAQAAQDPFVALALCGTAVSAAHAEHIRALSPTAVVVVLDEDGAGRAGRERAYLQLRESVADLLCPALPKGSDPADVLLASGSTALRKQLAYTRPLADQLVDDRLGLWPNLNENAEARVACLRETATLVARLRPADLTLVAARLPTDLNLSQQTVTRELAERVSPREGPPGPTSPPR
jgi:DNA primase